MRTTLLAAGLAIAGLALVAGPAEAGRVTREESTGDLVESNNTKAFSNVMVGRYRMIARHRPIPQDNGRDTPESLSVQARGLDVRPDDSGERPLFRVFARTVDTSDSVPSPSSREVDFGPLSVNSRGVGRMRITAPYRFAYLESNPVEYVATLRDFVGGTIEVRRYELRDVEGGGPIPMETIVTTVLSGDVSDFVEVDEHEGPGRGFGPRNVGRAILDPTRDGGDARGWLQAAFAPGRDGDFQAVHVQCDAMGSPGSNFSVVVVDPFGNSIFLGNMFTRTVFGDGTARSNSVGRLDVEFGSGPRLSVKNGRSESFFPEGGLPALSGWDIEVRDSEGAVWLTGVFPDLSGVR